MRFRAAFGIALSCSAVLFVAQEKPRTAEDSQAHAQWVAKCLADFKMIRVGMTRSEIEAKFPQDGGLQTVSPVRYAHPTCGYFKVDVEFDFRRNPADQNRAIRSAADKATHVSKPYIESPCFD